MKKKIKIIFWLMSCLFILTGCKKINSQELVMTAYENLLQMHIKIWMVGPELEGNPFLGIDGTNQVSYCKVNDSEIKTIKDIKDFTEETCTKEGAEKLYYKDYLEEQIIYYEKNEVLYRQLVEIPAICYGNIGDIVIVEDNKESIHAKMKAIDDNTGDSSMIDITIVRLGEKWLVNDINQIYEVEGNN